ncbi:hypothetical protein [Nostoc sp.]|uniref:hypothetical protein n=1 Tax=Nostoc sp. TaxID=1180 RepID=UPI002FF48C55
MSYKISQFQNLFYKTASGWVTVLHGFGASDCKTKTPDRFSWDKFSNTVFCVDGKGFEFGEIEEVAVRLLVLAGVCVFLLPQTRIDTELPEAGLGFGFVLITSKKAPGGSDWLFPKEI